MIYIIFFSISLLFVILGQFFLKINLRVLSVLSFITSILVVAIFSGYRNYGIGTDMTIYGTRWFNYAASSVTFSNFFSMISWEGAERGYALLNFVVSRFTTENYIFYTILAFLINGLILLAIFNVRDTVNMSIAWISYLLIYFPYTLNIMRQSVAISFMLLAFTYLFKKKMVPFIICLIASVFFHTSAIFIGIIMIILYSLISKSKNKTKLIMIISAISIIGILSFDKLIGFLGSLGILSSKYLSYLIKTGSIGDITVFGLLLKLPVIVLFIWKYKEFVNGKNKQSLFFLFAVLDLVLFQLRVVSGVFLRISYYFWIFQIISIPEMLEIIEDRREKWLMTILYLLYLTILFGYYTLYLRYNAVYPYISDLLGLR